MKNITYAKLMQKVDDGAAEINAWSEENGRPVADVTFHTMRSSKREYVAVTGKAILDDTAEMHEASPELQALGIKTITRMTGKPVAAVLAEHDRATLMMMRNMVSLRPR